MDELAAEQSEEGWRCILRLDDPPKFYPSPEALWVGHLFEPFARCCNEKLRAARAFSFYGDGGITSAKLGPPEDGAVHFQAIDCPRAACINT